MSTRRALRRLPPDEQPGHRMNVATMQLDRAGRTGALADVDAALDTVREVLSDTPRDHPHFAGRISMVSQGMQLRYTLSGDPADLTRAVDAARAAADATPDGHEDRAMYLSNFGRALLFRYQSTLDVSDLAEARVALLTAVAATTDDEPNRGTRYNALAHAHLETYQQTGDDGELDSGVRLAERAVAAATVVGDDNRFQWTVDLCTALLLRHTVRGDPDDERRGVALAREMADALPADHPLGAYARHIIAAADRPSEDQR